MNQLKIPDHGRSLGEDMGIALDAAFEAAEVIREGYGKLHTIETKGIGDLVSDVDRECDAKISALLKSRKPQDRIKSEELSPHEEESEDRLWIVDPLDATSGFLFQAGEEITSVMIALRDQMETQLGVILFPISGNCFYAMKGKGCFKNGERIKISKNANSSLKDAWVDMNHYGDSSLQTPSFTRLDQRLRSKDGAKLVTRNVPHSGIVTKLIEQNQRLSAIIHDNSQRKVKQEAWDITPAQIVLEEAGGLMVNINGQRIHPFKPELIIAAVNMEIANAIASLGRE